MTNLNLVASTQVATNSEVINNTTNTNSNIKNTTTMKTMTVNTTAAVTSNNTTNTISNTQNTTTMKTMAANTTAAATSNTVLEGFNNGVIYSLSDLESAGVKIARLKVNRAINDTIVKKKMASIKISGGVISPSLIVSAEACCEQNIEIVHLDGSSVSESELDKVVVLIDGQHRQAAITKLNEELKEGETPYENHLYFPLNDGCSIIKLLKEANVATSVWKNTDYFNAIINEQRDSEDELKRLSWIKGLIEESCSSETAAWMWGTFEAGRLPSKVQYNKADGSEKVRSSILKVGRFQYGKRIYEQMAELFGNKFVGRKAVPEFFIGEVNDLINTGSKTIKEATDTISLFIEHSFTEEVVAEIKAYKTIKSGDDGEGEKSRDSQIQSKFNELYAEFKRAYNVAA